MNQPTSMQLVCDAVGKACSLLETLSQQEAMEASAMLCSAMCTSVAWAAECPGGPERAAKLLEAIIAAHRKNCDAAGISEAEFDLCSSWNAKIIGELLDGHRKRMVLRG